MNLKDIRKGNIVSDGVISPFEIGEISGNILKGTYIQESEQGGICLQLVYNCEPIPITENILWSFGFKKTTYSNGHPAYYLYPKNYHNTVMIFLHNNKASVYIVNQSIRTLCYVHELQNLIYFITGNELILRNNEKQP